MEDQIVERISINPNIWPIFYKVYLNNSLKSEVLSKSLANIQKFDFQFMEKSQHC